MMSREPTREPAEGQLQLPPGFRFYPSDEELVVHYLCKKAASQPFAVPIIAEVDLYKFNPWDLPEKALFGEREWYFFSPRERKYPNGSRPNRAAGSGYWKATGTDKPISMHGSEKTVGVKKSLVFYVGKPPKGDKTKWIMHEYRLADSAAKAARRKGSLRLDDWVLCRIYKKSPSAMKLAMQKQLADRNAQEEGFEEVLTPPIPEMDDKKLVNQPRLSTINPSLINSNINESTTPRGHAANYSNFIELQRLQQYAAASANYCSSDGAEAAAAAAYNYNNNCNDNHQQEEEELQQYQQIMGSCNPLSGNSFIKSPLNHVEMINTSNYIGNNDHETRLLAAGLDPYNSNNDMISSSQEVSLNPGRPSLIRVHNYNRSSQNYAVNNSSSTEASAQDRTTDSFQSSFNFDGLPCPLIRGLGSF